MKTSHRLAAAVASIAITYTLFTAVISEARPGAGGPMLARSAATVVVAVR
jgi:hypothetical protein